MADWWNSAEWATLGTERGDDEVIRRSFLGLALVLGGFGWSQRHSIAAEVARKAVAGERLVGQLEELTLGMAASWDDGHPAQLQRRLLGFYTILEELAKAPPPAWAGDLAQLAGRNAALLGLMTRVTGHGERSLSYLLAADAWAQEAGDDGLRALIAVWRADVDSTVQAGLAGPSNEFVTDQLDYALGWSAAAAPAVRAFVLLRRAEEHAAAGEVAHAYRCLDRAAQADAQVTDRKAGLFGISWSASIMPSFSANVHVLAGEPAVAVPILEAVIPAARSNSNRVAAVTDLASACARLGEVEHAAELLTDALAAAQAGGLQERVRRIAGVADRDLAAHAAVPAVRRLAEALGGLPAQP